MYLDDLYKQLNVSNDFDKVTLAAMVYDTIRANNSISEEQEQELIDKLLGGLERYQFDIMLLASYWSNDLQDLLIKHLNLECGRGGLYKNILWPYINTHEVLPCIKC